MHGSHLLGIDIGTSGLKCALVATSDGRIVTQAYRPYSPLSPRPGWAEQEPDTWFDAAVAAVREVTAACPAESSSIAGIGFSGQMHSAVLLDSDLDAIAPAILWLDRRSTRQVESLKDSVGLDCLARWTGNPVTPGLTLSSLLWLREQAPDLWRRVAHVVLPKDYVRFRLTGELATDLSDASATGLLQVGDRCWCQDLLAAAGIPASILPPLADSAEVVGALRPEMADLLRLPRGIPVICGAGDQPAGAVGNGMLLPGLVSCTIGTGGQLLAVAQQYRYDPQLRLHTFCHAAPDRWYWLGATLAAGLSLRWLRDEVLGGAYEYSQLADAASSIEPGAEGLIYLPHLAGERTPHMNPNARGVFYGLTMRHTWRHMARAVMEGVVLSLLQALDLIRELGQVDRVIAAGGGTQHPLWIQLQADVLGLPVVRTQTQEAAAVGAALLAGVGAGVYPGLEAACRQAVHWSDIRVHPHPSRQETYRELAARYRSLYQALAPRFEADSGPLRG